MLADSFRFVQVLGRKRFYLHRATYVQHFLGSFLSADSGTRVEVRKPLLFATGFIGSTLQDAHGVVEFVKPSIPENRIRGAYFGGQFWVQKTDPILESENWSGFNGGIFFHINLLHQCHFSDPKIGSVF